MFSQPHNSEAPSARPEPAAEVRLMGLVDFDACLALQQRLVYEAGEWTDGRKVLLIAEHPAEITVGRQGSWKHIHFTERERTELRLNVRWVSRGGGCLLHLPGQLAVYPIVPLLHCRQSVGEYLNSLQAAIISTFQELGIAAQGRPGRYGVWGRTGQLAAIGAAVKNWVAWHGAFINVNPGRLHRRIDSDPIECAPMSSLAVERGRTIKMTRVREALIRHITVALGCPRYHLHTGHPLIPPSRQAIREPARSAG